MQFKRGHPYPGLWINFEAGEGAGKGTHIRLLEKYLKEKGFYVARGREPGGISVGEQYRIILQNPDMPHINPKTEILTYVAAGVELFDKAIRPVLEKNGIFLTDRWRYSTLAYQGYGLGIDINVIKTLTHFSCDGCYPDVNILLDIDAEKGLNKLTGHEFGKHRTDKIESRDLEYHKRVNEGYKKIALENPESFFVISYVEGAIEEMQNQIRKIINDYLEEYQLKDTLLKSKLPNI